MTRTPGGEAGFTLLEVLVALAVLALVGMAVIEAQAQALSGTRRAEARARALAIAASLLAERSAGARSDGRGTLPPDVHFTIASRSRTDLVRPGAPLIPVERIVQVSIRPAGAARLAAIDWTDGAGR